MIAAEITRMRVKRKNDESYSIDNNINNTGNSNRKNNRNNVCNDDSDNNKYSDTITMITIKTTAYYLFINGNWQYCYNTGYTQYREAWYFDNLTSEHHHDGARMD